MALALRPLQLVDVGAVSALGRSCDMAWPKEHLEALIHRPASFCRVAEHQGQIVGALTACIWPDEAELLDIAVAHAYRRQRIAQALLTELFTAAASKQSLRVVCEVAVDNRPALALYNALGFVEVAIRPGYFRSSSHADEGSMVAPIDAKLLERRLA